MGWSTTQQQVGKSPLIMIGFVALGWWWSEKLVKTTQDDDRKFLGGVVKVHFCLDIFGRKLLFNRQRIWCFGLSQSLNMAEKELHSLICYNTHWSKPKNYVLKFHIFKFVLKFDIQYISSFNPNKSEWKQKTVSTYRNQ